MKKLSEADIIRIMREEWNAKLKTLNETVDVAFKAKVDGKNVQLISPGLKIRHKESQLLYTVVSVGPHQAELKTPEGKSLRVDKDVLEKKYEID